jgi:L-ascorbate metabolism protein UlaG (beta-lactamase superfamily)
VFKTPGGDLKATFIGHGTLLMAYAGKAIHIDPVSMHADHATLPKAVRAVPESNIFEQPLNQGSGPGLLIALQQLEQTYPNVIVAVFPTDHYHHEIGG